MINIIYIYIKIQVGSGWSCGYGTRCWGHSGAQDRDPLPANNITLGSAMPMWYERRLDGITLPNLAGAGLRIRLN